MKKILLVDDDIPIFNIIKRFLHKEYIIDYASNGKEGLSLCNKNNYDIIFTDLSMPIMNGKDLIKEIRKKNKKIPIVLMTGSNESIIMNDIQTINKPFDLDEIKQTLEKFCPAG